MKFAELLEIVGDEPVFESGFLLAGEVNAKDVRRQLSRWTRSGRLHQLRRGLYTLAPPFRKVTPHPFLVANHLVPSSYVSCHSALAFHGIIPEAVRVTTSVTTGRPVQFETPLGNHTFRHVKRELFRGFEQVDLGGQSAFVATPHKALLDLVHLTPGADHENYLAELRLQNIDRLDVDVLTATTNLVGGPKLRRAAGLIANLVFRDSEDSETL